MQYINRTKKITIFVIYIYNNKNKNNKLYYQ